jgi:GDPmannose 4,6-dehydratase
VGRKVKFYNAASSEVFGDINGAAADEVTPFSPRSPDAVAKATAVWEVANYREADGLFACSGILFNHDSPLRPERFVTQKIVASAVRIAAGTQDKLYLGNIGYSAGLGLGGGLCRGDVFDAATGAILVPRGYANG